MTLKEIAAYFNVSTDFLLDKPIGPADTEAESDLIRIFRSLNSEQQALYIELGKAFYRI